MVGTGRKPIDLEPYKDELIEKHRAGTTLPKLVKWLKEDMQVKIEVRSLGRRFTEWGVPKRRVWLAGTDQGEKLKEAMLPLILQKLDDDKIFEQLKAQGFQVSMWHVSNLRKEMGMRRRHDRGGNCEACKKQGRYPKEACPHQAEHAQIPQRKPAEVSKALREEVKALKKQIRDMQAESKKKEKEHEKLQKENEKLKEELRNANWRQQFLDPAITNRQQYEQYPEPPRWHA